MFPGVVWSRRSELRKSSLSAYSISERSRLMVDRELHTREVTGSIPVPPTIFKALEAVNFALELSFSGPPCVGCCLGLVPLTSSCQLSPSLSLDGPAGSPPRYTTMYCTLLLRIFAMHVSGNVLNSRRPSSGRGLPGCHRPGCRRRRSGGTSLALRAVGCRNAPACRRLRRSHLAFGDGTPPVSLP